MQNCSKKKQLVPFSSSIELYTETVLCRINEKILIRIKYFPIATINSIYGNYGDI